MKRYRTVFSSFHNIYRLATSLSDLTNFATGICRLFRNIFRADKVVMICKIIGSNNFLKIRIENSNQYIKKGGKSILTRVEKEILRQEKKMVFPNRIISPLFFLNTLGVIYVRRETRTRYFDDIERAWFSALCEEIGIGLKIFHLYQEQHKLMLSYIRSLTDFLTQHVPTSYLHIKSTSWLIKALGKAMKLSETEIEALKQAVLLHDAGKIQLPFKLLKKQRPLTPREFKLITKHPRKGVELIKNLEALRPVIPIILHHHERWDGQGYPSKLKRESIPLGSRMLAILDAFDAMHFGRPYKKKLSIDEIEQEFHNQSGKQFDPKIVDIFLKVLKRKSSQKYLKIPSKN